MRVQILPDNLASRLSAGPPDEIEYRLRVQQGKAGDWRRSTVQTVGSTVFTDVWVSPDAKRIELRVDVDGKRWRSDPVSIYMPVKLKKK